MAFSSRASSVSTAIPDEKVEQWSDQMYHRAAQEPTDARLTQEDLLSFGVVSDLKHLMVVVNRLVGDLLLKPMSQGGQTFWKWRSQDEAKKIGSIPNREFRLIYEYIDEAGAEGIWARSIRYRTHVSDLSLKNGLKWLEAKGYISEFKSVEHPNKKMYIKASLRPSEKATGGPWFTDGLLDVGFLNSMQQVVFYLIKQRSTAAATAADRVENRDGGDHDDRHRRRRTLPLPAGYTQYPTALAVVQIVNRSNMTRDPVTHEAVTLTQADMQQVIDLLVYERRVEPVRLPGGRTGYRVARPAAIPASREDENDDILGVAQARRPNGFSEIPCSNCPVFHICEPGGEVSPATCPYYDEWLHNIASSS